jgi:Beta-galactosidase
MRAPQRSVLTSILLTIALPIVCVLPALGNGKTDVGELAQYINPFQKKGYQNESQDRIIKKKAFKLENMPSFGTAANQELGFFAILPTDKLAAGDYVEQLLANDRVNGISAAFPWSRIEPSEDKYQWDQIDQLLAACQRHHKTLMLRITTCGTEMPAGNQQATIPDTPTWVFSSGVKSINFYTGDGVVHTMPLFWDNAYLAKWSNFVTELSSRYDKNPTIHSIGITGGGFGIGTAVTPPNATMDGTAKSADLTETLKSQYGMTQRQIVEHWKYVADIFPKRFTTARLNFNVNAPVRGRWGEDALDEIADYLVYRYGERVYLTRSGIANGKHSFDDYRLLLKFHHDTLTGWRLANEINVQDLDKVTKNALDDGISFAELPVSLLDSKNPQVLAALDRLLNHIGYQLIDQQVQISNKVSSGEPLKASFSFVNMGAATAMRPERNLDKDAPMSYRILVELRDAEGKPALQNLHTPPTPTSQWEPGKSVAWEEDLKMVGSDKHQLPPGDYSVWVALVDPNGNRKIHFLHATSDGKPASSETAEVGKLTITASVADTKTDDKAVGSAADTHQ